ncbi:MAG: RNA polymerase sigma factor [Bacteroidia bacterium]|nr:MAG: RNA polymerase sigma factor [Bacteroidia bacterium]
MATMKVAAGILSDEEIIARVLDGEKELYELIMRRHNQRLFKICRAYVRDGDEAEDIVQEAYVKAYEQLPRFEQRAKFSTWLIRILINEALAHIRRNGRFTSIEPDEGGMNAGMIHEPHSPENETPSERTMNDELKNVLEEAIDALPEKYRSVFVMRAIEGMSVAETSESLKISQENVKVRLNRAKEMLRRRIGKVYRDATVYHFDLVRCNRIVANVLKRVKRYEGIGTRQ